MGLVIILAFDSNFIEQIREWLSLISRLRKRMGMYSIKGNFCQDINILIMSELLNESTY